MLLIAAMSCVASADDKAKKDAGSKKKADAKKDVGSEKKEEKSEKKEKPVKTREVKLRDLVLNVPVTWKQKEPSSRLRLGHFDIPAVGKDKEDGELGIFNFGGGGGGVKANAERWIGQFDSKDVKYKLSTAKSTSGEYVIVDVTGTYNKPIGPPIRRQTKPVPNARMLGVILALEVGKERKGTYFLKLTGPKETITAAATALRTSFGAKEKDEESPEVKSRKEKKEE
ncbi:MAG: hypothetical protein CMJ78_19030 [Planctomycetaceae bacterium]|nr:hypothetical protein [Planctomycetaceae bacterium]